jgi:hypothetical protein
MELSADATLSFPRPVVFAAYRDRLTALLEYLPNVRDIEVRSRAEEGTRVKLVNVWHGGGEIPRPARAFLSESMLSWTDRAEWDETTWMCHWAIETHAFTEAVRCQGFDRFVEVAGGTRIEIRGSLAIDAGKVRGVPRLLAARLGHAVEEFLVSRIRPNLVEVTDGLRRYLEKTVPSAG